MFRKGFASFLIAAAATAVVWTGSASAQVRVASLQNGLPQLAAASTENRIALVIGNSNYLNNKALPNPGNDAQAVAQLLNTAGFEVVMAFDLGRDIMRQSIEEFAARVNEKGKDAVVLVYYAGHGLQVDGENFLVPVDAKFENESDVTEQGVKLADIMGALETIQSKTRIVILDACRNNPFSADAGGKGLAIVDAPAGTIVAYSTAPGTEAFDGAGKHSPYAAAFMKTVKQPNMPIEQVFKRVRVLVHEATDAKQTPWESSSLTNDFVFFTNADGSVATPAAPVKLALTDLGARPVNVAYEAVIAEDSVEYYEEFIRLHPTDPLCDRIRRLLSRRQQMIAWQNVTHTNTPEAYASFASKFGNSDLFRAARRLQEKPRLINIAFPRKGEGRFGDGRFGNGRINIGNGNGNGRPVIDFPRGNGGRPVINNPQINNGGLRPINNPQVVNPNGGRPVIGVPQNGQNGRPVIGVPQNGQNGRPVINVPQGGQNGQAGRVAGLPNGTPGTNNPNTGNPNGGRVIPFPQNGQNGRPVINGNPGINPNAGRPVIQNQPQIIQRQPQVIQRQPQVIQRAPQVQVQRAPQVQIQRAPQVQIQRQSFQAPRQSFQPRVVSGGGGGGGFRGRR